MRFRVIYVLTKEKEEVHMILSFNVTGPDRKRLVRTIEESTGEKAKYLGVPSCAYRVGDYEISKEGQLIFSDDIPMEESSRVIDDCVMAGFEPAEWDANEDEVSITVSVPEENLTDEEFVKLQNLISAKGRLIRKALGIESLELSREEEKVSFPWIKNSDADEVRAVTNLISALCETARTQKRINATEKAVPNEKYAFRCFLLRLGFIGDEYKVDRKVLLKNFEGSSAFKVKKEA